MTTALGFVQAFLTLSFTITLVKLSGDSGGGNYFFTLLWLVLMGTAGPYLLAMALMRRVTPPWATAIGIGAAVFGAIDVAIRMQAFFFPTERSGGGMALWLPIYSLGLIPLFAIIAHTMLGVAARNASVHETRAGNDPGPRI